jgi:sigma-B regulation protein RsbU (phosphoserine phosphatase)
MNSEKNLTLAILTYAEGKISISGQHEETIVVRKGGATERINTINLGFPIGLEAEISDFIDHTILDLNEDDGIVLYSDGIPEAYSMDKKQYGLEKLCEVISQNWHQSAEKIKQVIIDDVKRHIGEQKVFDDITLVVLKRKFSQNQEILETQNPILEPEPELEPELEPEPEPEPEIPHNGGKRKRLGFFRRQSFL